MHFKDFIVLRNLLTNDSVIGLNIIGYIEDLNKESLSIINRLEACIIEVENTENIIIGFSDIKNQIGKTIKLKVSSGQFPQYFETFEELIDKHQYTFNLDDFYIHSENIDHLNSTGNNLFINYKENLDLIDFLQELSDNKVSSSGNLELYFHKIDKSLILPISYSVLDLKKTTISNINSFKEKITNSIHSEDKRKLLINDLIDFYENKEKEYSLLLEKWKNLNSIYDKSINSYLEGFSFEKIKTSSLVYFQEITDKIHETLRKVSSYLFAIPIAYLFLASRLEFKEPSFAKNITLLILGYAFFFLIWFIFFKNIEESLNSLKKEIVRYQEKIKSLSHLQDIKNDLSLLRSVQLNRQFAKLQLLKTITVLIVIILTLAVVVIHKY